MTILVNTDNHIAGKEQLNTYITTLFNEKLARFNAHLTRVEVHLSDENAGKAGADDKNCNIEARLEGFDPIFASAQSEDISAAIHDALQKIKRGIEHHLDKVKG
jgi:ribosomal subunit interface protein